MKVLKERNPNEMNWADYFDALCNERYLFPAPKLDQLQIRNRDVDDGQDCQEVRVDRASEIVS